MMHFSLLNATWLFDSWIFFLWCCCCSSTMMLSTAFLQKACENKEQNNNKPNQDEVVDMMQLQKSLLNTITCFFVCVAVLSLLLFAIANQCRQKGKFSRVSELINFLSANCLAWVRQDKFILGAPLRCLFFRLLRAKLEKWKSDVRTFLRTVSWCLAWKSWIISSKWKKIQKWGAVF